MQTFLFLGTSIKLTPELNLDLSVIRTSTVKNTLYENIEIFNEGPAFPGIMISIAKHNIRKFIYWDNT